MLQPLEQARGVVRLLEGATGNVTAHRHPLALLEQGSASHCAESELLGMVLHKVSEVTGLHVSATDSFRDLGLDSIATGQVVHELRKVLPLSPAALTGKATIGELVDAAAVKQQAGDVPDVAISFTVVDMLRMPLCVLVMIYHSGTLPVTDPRGRDSLWGASVAVAFFMSASFAFWQLSYPHGQALYGKQVRLWMYARLATTLPMYYIVLAVQQFYYFDFFMAHPEVIRSELLNWFGAGVLVGYWIHGDSVIWFLAAQAWLILLFPMATSALRLQPEMTWQKLALLVAIAWGFFPVITWLGAPTYFSHGHPAYWAAMMPLCAAVTSDVSSDTPLLTNARLRRATISLLCIWFASETLWFSEKGAYAINPYVRPITALAVPFLLQPAVVWGHFEGFVASPVGRLLSAFAPYSMGFFLWQGIPASLDMRVQKAAPPCPSRGCHWGDNVDVDQSAWKATLYKLVMLAAISYASLHLLERPLNGAFKRLLSSRPSRAPKSFNGHEMV